MNDAGLDDAIVDKVHELMRVSRECAAVDPIMAAKFAATAADMSRDLGIDISRLGTCRYPSTLSLLSETEPSPRDGDNQCDDDEDDEEFEELMHLISLQRRAVQSSRQAMPPAPKRSSVAEWFRMNGWPRR